MTIQITKQLKHSLIAVAMATALFGCNQASKDDANQTDDSANANVEQTEQQNADNATTSEMVTIQTARGEMQLPANPHPVVVYDMTLLQNLAALGVPVEGAPDISHIKAKDIHADADSKLVGTLFEPDMEALNAMQPKAILIGGRMAAKYDELSNMAKTADLSIDTKNSYESSKQQLADLGKLFNKTEKAQQLQQDIDDAIAKAKAAAEGKGNALIIMVNGNKLAAFGDKSRFGFIHTNFAIPMADSNIEDARHGQPVSFEYLQKVDPDWIFVLDRTSAVGEEGEGAEAVLDNPLVHETKAWKNKHILYLSPDAYLAYAGYNQWIKDANLVSENFAKASKVE